MRRFFQAAVAIGALLASGCGGPPQFTADEACLNAVDALWTAVTAQQKPWLEDSVRELERLRDAGKLSGEAWEALEVSIAMARQGRWEAAAQELYDLIKAQRKSAPAR